MRKWLLLCVFPLLVAGCNTVAGMGKDIEKAGEIVQDSAK
jgi:predicted small secreted protein